MGRAAPTAVIFDMDGTLFDSTTVVPDAYIATVLACGGRRYERSDVIAAYTLGPPAVMLAHLLDRACADGDVDRYHNRLLELAHDVQVYDGIAETLAELSGVIPLAVFTGASVKAAEILLEATDLRRHFQALVGGDEVSPKPDPAGIHLACARLGTRADQAAYVGDAPVDLEAARRSGARPFAAGWVSLTDPVAADELLTHPRDLLDLVTP